VAAGVAAPMLRKKLKLPKAAALGAAAIAPAAASVAMPAKRRSTYVTVCFLQMLAYIAAYEMPNDNPEELQSRVRIDYPVDIDRVIGFGRIPTQRLQEAFAHKGQVNRFERVLVWSHWIWFAVPHTTLAYMLWRKPEKFPSAAARMYAVFDIGAFIYWTLPTAPPWYAAANGHVEELDPNIIVGDFGHRYDIGAAPLPVRRIMLEYGEQFWGRRWNDLYAVLGGNPLAAMPSLHFASSYMAARVLSEIGPVSGAVGWTYVGTLGTALVYLGEHYAIDVIAGGVLAETVHRAAKPASPAARMIARAVGRLHTIAHKD
jgi:membrane-associated phospholipid phosphatase